MKKPKELLGFTCNSCKSFSNFSNGYYTLQQIDGFEKEIENHFFCSADCTVNWFDENRGLVMLKEAILKKGLF